MRLTRTGCVLFLLFASFVNLNAETRRQTALSYLELGNKFADAGDFDRAIGAYNIALQFAPDFVPAFFHRALAYEARGYALKAIADYTSALEIVPGLTTAYNRGNLLLNEGDLDGALSDFNKAVESDPRYVMAYNNRGIAKIAKGDQDGAMADFNEAIKIDPHHPEAYVNRGLLRLQQGMKAEAERDFARSIAVRPSLKTFIESRISQISQRHN